MANGTVLTPPCSITFYTMLPSLLCFSHLRWNFVYQRPQHLMSRYALRAPVYFIEEPVYDKGWQGLQVSTPAKSLRVITPNLSSDLPVMDRELSVAVMLQEFIKTNRIGEFISWYYSPMALGYSKSLFPLLTVYDCMDELSSFKFAPPELKERENLLFQMADVVFTGGHTLFELKKLQHDNVYAFPSSIDKEHFQTARLNHTDPADQREIRHPRFGFYGVLDERLNIELVRDLALARPDWHFVFIGPIIKIEEDALPAAANIHYLGAKDYKELPLYLSGWDVAIMPFALNASTKYISPTKTPEYLAGGKPVISTSISDVVNDYGRFDLVRIADTTQDFIQAGEAILNNDNREEWLAEVDKHLADNSWDKTFNQMTEIITAMINLKSIKSKAN